MNDLIQNAVTLSLPLLSLVFVRFFPKRQWKIPLIVILAIISLILPIGMGVCSLNELPLLFQYTGHLQDALIVGLVILLWTQIYTNGGIGFVKSSKWKFLLEGMCMGILPLLALRDNNSEIKIQDRRRWLILFGTCIGVTGNPIVTMHSHRINLIVSLAFLFLILAYSIKFTDQDNVSTERTTNNPYQYVNGIVFLIVSVSILTLPTQTYTILLLANILLLPISMRNFLHMEQLSRKIVINVSLWYVSVIIMTQISIIGGTAELLSWGVEEIQFNYGRWFPLAVLLLGIILGALFDAVVMILLGTALFTNALDLIQQGQDISNYIFIGCVVAFVVNAYFISFSKPSAIQESSLQA